MGPCALPVTQSTTRKDWMEHKTTAACSSSSSSSSCCYYYYYYYYYTVSQKTSHLYNLLYFLHTQFDCDNFWHKCCRESRQL